MWGNLVRSFSIARWSGGSSRASLRISSAADIVLQVELIFFFSCVKLAVCDRSRLSSEGDHSGGSRNPSNGALARTSGVAPGPLESRSTHPMRALGASVNVRGAWCCRPRRRAASATGVRSARAARAPASARAHGHERVTVNFWGEHGGFLRRVLRHLTQSTLVLVSSHSRACLRTCLVKRPGPRLLHGRNTRASTSQSSDGRRGAHNSSATPDRDSANTRSVEGEWLKRAREGPRVARERSCGWQQVVRRVGGFLIECDRRSGCEHRA